MKVLMIITILMCPECKQHVSVSETTLDACIKVKELNAYDKTMMVECLLPEVEESA